MEVRCERCQARYRVADEKIGPQGLTMKCGKCGNQFRVSRDGVPVATMTGQQPLPLPPPARRPEPGSNAAATIGQSPVAPARPATAGPRAAATASASTLLSKPSAVATAKAPVARPAAPATASPASDGASQRMLFQTGDVEAPPPAAKTAPKLAAEARPSGPDGDPTVVFGQSPLSKPGPDAGASAAGAVPAASAAKAEVQSSVDPQKAEPAAPPVAAGASAEGTFAKAPPRGRSIGIAAGAAALVVILLAFGAVKKLGHPAPPPAALDALAAAQGAADKDSLASLADAEARAKDAIDQAGARAQFPQGPAQLARIDVQWADALGDQATLLAAKGKGEADDAKKAATAQKVFDLQTEAKSKLTAAFDTLTAAIKADPGSPDLELALAEYYRAQRSGSKMNEQLKRAQALKADDARVSLVQGEALAQEEGGGEKAVPKLKAALAAAPQSARIHFRLAMADLSMHNNDEALRELKEVLRLSPQHERARLLIDQLATTTGQ